MNLITRCYYFFMFKNKKWAKLAIISLYSGTFSIGLLILVFIVLPSYNSSSCSSGSECFSCIGGAFIGVVFSIFVATVSLFMCIIFSILSYLKKEKAFKVILINILIIAFIAISIRAGTSGFSNYRYCHKLTACSYTYPN